MPIQLSDRDYEAVVKTVYGEARGEGPQGMLAVAWVIRNRVESRVTWWGNDYYSVCHARLQFSCWNADDPNSKMLGALDMGSRLLANAKAAVAAMVLATPKEDPTWGAHLYHTVAKPAWAKVWPPAWAAKAIKTTTVGAHVFYKEPGA